MQRDAAYIRDILESAGKALFYVEGVERQDFDQNILLQDAVIRRLEIIGEAARRISDQTKQANPAIPWRQMVGMRNQVIHMYDGIDLNIVWRTLTSDLPSLLQALKQLPDLETN